MTPGTLTLFTGKMGAGKTTCSKLLAAQHHAVRLSEDEWLAAVYPDQIKTLKDYLVYSNRLKPQMKKLVQSMLTVGTNVVMDFPGNTRQQRSWLKNLADEVNATHQLVFLDVPDGVCLQRIEQRRNNQPERAATDTAEVFHQVSRFFEPPDEDEGFDVVRL